MSLDQLLKQVKQHPGFDRVGMVLCHNGVVRGTSRDGRRTTGLEVSVDHQRLKAIVAAQKKTPGDRRNPGGNQRKPAARGGG